MNWGYCPYQDCDGEFDFMEVPDKSPVWYPIECPKCNRKVWYKLSRIDPEAFTLEDFNKRFIVDEKARTIEERV